MWGLCRQPFILPHRTFSQGAHTQHTSQMNSFFLETGICIWRHEASGQFRCVWQHTPMFLGSKWLVMLLLKGLFTVRKLPRNKYFSNDGKKLLAKEDRLLPLAKVVFCCTCRVCPGGQSKVASFCPEMTCEWEVLHNEGVIFLCSRPFSSPEKTCQWKTMN